MGVLVPYARLDYVREFKDDIETAKVRFANDRFQSAANPMSNFAVTTEGPDANYIVWAVGAHAQFIRGISAFIDYRGISGLKDLSFNEVSVGLRFESNL
jgi:uncharacterized protein YhjY with autotransporter beta-barrel domain